MAKKETYNLVKDYHQSVRTMHKKAESFEDTILDRTKSVLSSDAFESNFLNKDKNEYTEFDTAVLGYINDIVVQIQDSDLKSSYSDVMNKYTVILNELAKD